MPDSVTIKYAVAVVGGTNVIITNIGDDQWLVSKDGDSSTAFPVQGYDKAVAATDVFATKVAAVDDAQAVAQAALDTFVEAQQQDFEKNQVDVTPTPEPVQPAPPA